MLSGQAVLPAGSTSWSSSVLLSPNDGDFPLHTLPPSDDDAYHGRNLPENDLRAFLTGIYVSAPFNRLALLRIGCWWTTTTESCE